MRYRITSGGSHGRFENGVSVTYRRGDEIDLNEAEVSGASLRDRIELVDSPIEPPVGDALIGSVDLTGLHWVKAVQAVREMDEGGLYEALEAEQRVSVIVAINERLREIGEADK